MHANDVLVSLTEVDKHVNVAQISSAQCERTGRDFRLITYLCLCVLRTCFVVFCLFSVSILAFDGPTVWNSLLSAHGAKIAHIAKRVPAAAGNLF